MQKNSHKNDVGSTRQTTKGFASMRVDRIGILLVQVVLCLCFRSRRLRRQTLPSQHVQVHSLDSNVMYNDKIYVESTENRIDINEKNLNGSVWSDHSLLNFDSLDTFVNVSADNAESFLGFRNGANIYGQAVKTNLYIHTNRTEDGQTALSQALLGDSVFSIDDDMLRVQAIKGRRIAVDALTWQRAIEKKMVLGVDSSHEERNLRLEAIGNTYHVLATFDSSMIFIHFADKIIVIDPSFRTLEVFTDKFNVTVQAKDVPFDLTLTQEEAVINLPTQRTRVCVTLEGVSVRSNNIAKTHVDRNGGQMTVGGKTVEANGATIVSKATDLVLNNAGQINADMENSRFYVENNVQRIGLTAEHHNMKIDQGSPHITVEPGEACIDIIANSGMPRFGELVPPFRPPIDKFGKLGPFPGDPRAETEFMNRPSCCSSIQPIVFPSDIGIPTRRPSTGGNSGWSEWGNAGSNGGWRSDNSWQPEGEGGNPWATWENAARTSSPGNGDNWRKETIANGPQFGQWPTFSSLEGGSVTRRTWSPMFATKRPTQENWEKETGCICHTSATERNGNMEQWRTPAPTVQSSSSKPPEPVTEAPISTYSASTASSEPLEEETVATAVPTSLTLAETQPTAPATLITEVATPLQPVTELPTQKPTPVQLATQKSTETQTQPVTSPPTETHEEIITLQPITESTISLIGGTTFFPQKEWSGGAGTREETEPSHPEETTQPATVHQDNQTEGAIGNTAIPHSTDDDFAFAHYASTLYPDEVPIEATVSTIDLNTPGNGEFPVPIPIVASQVNSSDSQGDWIGGASDLQETNSSTEHFPMPEVDISTMNFNKRSPLMLKLRIPRGTNEKSDFSKSIINSLKRVIRGVARRRIRKRDLSNEAEIVKINSMKSNEDTLEVIFDVLDNNAVDASDILSLSRQEIAQYFEYPVVSLERIVEIGDDRLIYIMIALGAVLLTIFCVCCIFQSIVKEMSRALLHGVNRRFSKAQQQQDQEPPIAYVNTGSSY